jgi:hypothetical protein
VALSSVVQDEKKRGAVREEWSSRLSAGISRLDRKHPIAAAVMVLAAGGREGGADNRHARVDQWLFVIAPA